MSLQSVVAKDTAEHGPISFDFSAKPIVVEASAGALTSDAGLLPIAQLDEQLGVTGSFAAALWDAFREGSRCTVLEMTRSRVLGILAGYEDQNDHAALRHDPVFKLIAGRMPADAPLASQPTLSRFENAVSVRDLFRLRDWLADRWLDSFAERPTRVTLDVDPVDDAAHGEQQLIMFHGYYEQWQYFPCLISHAESEQYVALSLRPGNVHASLGADDDLEYVVGRLRERWPDVEVVVRGDAGFGVPAMYAVCERLGLTYTFGLASNPRLREMTENLLAEAQRRFAETGQPQRLFAAFSYRARSWSRPRTVVAKVECNAAGTNRRFVVTNRPGAFLQPEGTYDEYVMRGESENRNKEIKTDLAIDRLSDHRFCANLFRMYLHTAAHLLAVRLRRAVRDFEPTLAEPVTAETPATTPPAAPTPAAAPIPTEAWAGKARRDHQRRRRERDPLGWAQPCTLRLRLIKVAAEVIVTARRVVVRLAANWPFLDYFFHVARRLLPRPAS